LGTPYNKQYKVVTSAIRLETFPSRSQAVCFAQMETVLLIPFSCTEATLVGININEDKTKYVQIKRTGIKDTTHLKN
jgi:hypothetical protein